jgi:hypothetical protein
MSKQLVFICNCPAEKVEEKFGSDVWTGRPLIPSTGEVDTLLESKDVVAIYIESAKVPDLERLEKYTLGLKYAP